MRTQPTSKQPVTIHNVHIIDASGSMAGTKFDSACKLINNEIDEFKKQTDVDLTYSCVIFSSRINTVIWKDKTPMKVGRHDYIGGLTALNDALGETLIRLLKENTIGDKILVKVFTDGAENNSTRFHPNMVKELIKEASRLGHTVTFAGTAFDVERAIKTYGIDKSNTIAHGNTAESISGLTKDYIVSTNAYFKSVVRGEDTTKGFFKTISND